MTGIRTGRFNLLAVLMLASPLAIAQTATTATTTTITVTTGTGTPATTSTTSQPATATTPESKLVAQFTELAGSKENAASLVSGLRTGSAITLNAPTTSGTPSGTSGTTPITGASSTFTAPTKPMGYGNVRIALSLARTQLASQGITNPTPEQLQTALVGAPAGTGTSSTQSGILQMRADGMGWGKIANSMGVKLGAVMSGKQTWPAPGTTTGTTAGSSGVTTAAGSAGKASGVTTGAGHSSKHSGVTTAAGGNGSGGITTGLGHAQGGGMAYGQVSRGAVNAGGGQAGSMAGGNGHGNGGGKH